MPSPAEYLLDPTLRQVSYDGTNHRVARFRGPGQPWDVLLRSRRGVLRQAGACQFHDLLGHWQDIAAIDQVRSVRIVRECRPADSSEAALIAEIQARLSL
jgi:hypothetical protein